MEIKIVTGEQMPEKVRQAQELLALNPLEMAMTLNVGEYMQLPLKNESMGVMDFVVRKVWDSNIERIFYPDHETCKLWRIK